MSAPHDPGGGVEVDSDAFWARLTEALARVPAEAATPPPQARIAAVLVLLRETDEGPSVVITRRRRDLRSHPGQLSFPGGRIEEGETVEVAALREADEEVGLRADSVEVVGPGPAFYIPPSRFWVVPVLARWTAPHALEENPWEVDEILHVPIAHLLDPARWRHTPLSIGTSAWAWQLDDDLLWGATAVVMALLLDTALAGWNGGREPADLGDELAVRPWEHVPSWQRRARLVGDLPSVPQADVVHVTRAQIRSAREWADARGVDGAARAEQAGRAGAHAVRRLVGGDVTGTEVTVLAGPSANGWAGLVAGRLLLAAGARVEVVLAGSARSPAAVQVLRDAGARIVTVGPSGPDTDADGSLDRVSPGEVVVDALLGSGAEPPLRDAVDVVAAWLRRHDVPVVALDLPSGVSADDGLRGACVTADVTVAFGAPAQALERRIVHPYAGDLYLADLGLPPAAWEAAGVAAPTVFGAGPLVRLTAEERATDAGTPDQGEVPGSSRETAGEGPGAAPSGDAGGGEG